MPEIELVIFDCDGVLIDSEIVAAAAELEVYSEFGVEMEPLEFARRMAGMNAAAVKQQMEADLGRALPDSVVPETRKRVNAKVIAEAGIIAGADDILDAFDQARCVCSNAPPERLEQVLDRVGLFDRFRPYVFSAQTADPPIFKPKPDLFLNAIDALSASPRTTLVIEDSAPGVIGAHQAGARVVGFTGATHSYPGHGDELIEAGAETVISKLADLPNVISAFSEWDGLV